MVYFISDGEYVKIGKADEPEKRLKELQTGNARELEIKRVIDDPLINGYELESKLHYVYSGKRVRGEWFLESKVNIDIDAKDLDRRVINKLQNDTGIKNLVEWAIAAINRDSLSYLHRGGSLATLKLTFKVDMKYVKLISSIREVAKHLDSFIDMEKIQETLNEIIKTNKRWRNTGLKD